MFEGEAEGVEGRTNSEGSHRSREAGRKNDRIGQCEWIDQLSLLASSRSKVPYFHRARETELCP